MRWFVVTSFLRKEDQPWIHDEIHQEPHRFTIVPATYAHDRSRSATSGREWLDYLRQAWRAWLQAWRSPDKPAGFITAFPPNAVCVGLIKRLTGSKMPIVAWTFNLSRRFEGRKRTLAAFALKRVDKFIVFSRREIVTYSEMLGLPQDRFIFVPFTEEMVEPQFSEDMADPFILAMGTANRDYATLIAAVKDLGVRTVIIAGSRAIDAATVPPNVTVMSGLSLATCHELCQKARINVVPIDTDDTASGQVTVRYAQMFGRACIATASIGTEDYIEHGVTGMLVPPGDAPALASAIEALWTDAPRRAAMGQAARAWLLANAGFEVGPQRMAAILEQVRLAPPV
jgi:glycosyltransferase involved in cell wall biosynthesis